MTMSGAAAMLAPRTTTGSPMLICCPSTHPLLWMGYQRHFRSSRLAPLCLYYTREIYHREGSYKIPNVGVYNMSVPPKHTNQTSWITWGFPPWYITTPVLWKMRDSRKSTPCSLSYRHTWYCVFGSLEVHMRILWGGSRGCHTHSQTHTHWMWIPWHSYDTSYWVSTFPQQNWRQHGSARMRN